MTDAEKILELMHDGDRAEEIMSFILADRERLIEALKKIDEGLDEEDAMECANNALAQSAQTNDEILGERE